jgi:hypothetical protein
MDGDSDGGNPLRCGEQPPPPGSCAGSSCVCVCVCVCQCLRLRGLRSRLLVSVAWAFGRADWVTLEDRSRRRFGPRIGA